MSEPNILHTASGAAALAGPVELGWERTAPFPHVVTANGCEACGIHYGPQYDACPLCAAQAMLLDASAAQREAVELLALATAFLVNREAEPMLWITVTRREQEHAPPRWSVDGAGRQVLTLQGEWIYEPMPSSQTPEFYARTRWDSCDEALAAARTAAERLEARWNAQTGGLKR